MLHRQQQITTMPQDEKSVSDTSSLGENRQELIAGFPKRKFRKVLIMTLFIVAAVVIFGSLIGLAYRFLYSTDDG